MGRALGKMSLELLHHLLQLPEGVQIRGITRVTNDIMNNSVTIILDSNSFPNHKKELCNIELHYEPINFKIYRNVGDFVFDRISWQEKENKEIRKLRL